MWKKRGKKLAQKRKKIGIAAAAVIVAAAGSTLIYHNLPQTKVEKQLTLAAKYMTEMNYLEAQEAYTEALSIDEGSVRAYRGLADDYAAQGQLDEAAEILKLLKETDGYISGQELCEKFGVSRTAIWKVINQLKEEGYKIEAVRNKGYILKGSADVLSKEELESTIHTKWAGANVVFFEETVSTNNEIRSLAEQGAPHGTLAVAEQQLGGKGRRGRVWTSPAGVGIWMSMLLRPQIDPLAASMLTLVMALAAKKGIEISTGLKSEIKWPNDLVLNKKKICGILTEMSTELMEIQYVIPGIGIRYTQQVDQA